MEVHEARKRPEVRNGWLTDLFTWGISGGLVGAVVAVNVVIYAGIERGLRGKDS